MILESDQFTLLKNFLETNPVLSPYKYALYIKRESTRTQTLITNYHETWITNYIEKSYFEWDYPIIAERLGEVIEWGVHNFTSDLTVAQKKIFLEATDYNLLNGISIQQAHADAKVIFTLSSSYPFENLQGHPYYENIPFIISRIFPLIHRIIRGKDLDHVQALIETYMKNDTRDLNLSLSANKNLMRSDSQVYLIE